MEETAEERMIDTKTQRHIDSHMDCLWVSREMDFKYRRKVSDYSWGKDYNWWQKRSDTQGMMMTNGRALQSIRLSFKPQENRDRGLNLRQEWQKKVMKSKRHQNNIAFQTFKSANLLRTDLNTLNAFSGLIQMIPTWEQTESSRMESTRPD
jgi:hypothetical protein